MRNAFVQDLIIVFSQSAFMKDLIVVFSQNFDFDKINVCCLIMMKICQFSIKFLTQL